ncbi:hypothetical protein F5Y06DRAFT_128658 [Hypoxylon sp. FL0890]|nr:hypothetical protein F5Y06DRAFT_128658 [Hypoxylon sp. FL0890]
MPRTKARLRSSRRVPPLRDSEIDHEINLEDRTVSVEETRPLTADTGTINNIDHSTSHQPLISSDSRAPSTQPPDIEEAQQEVNADTEAGPSGEHDASQHSAKDAGHSIKENGVRKSYSSGKRRTRLPKKPETAIDILYENQRGGFFCGIPLFSAAALGNLDPPPWTNFAHKPSPTDIHTAQVPDPSWEWAWPEWRINRDKCRKLDAEGWEYSFMFSKKFSWHGPKWYNSFVRRRTWIRKRVKKGLGYQANDPYMGSPEYFSITPTRSNGERPSIDQLSARLVRVISRRSRDTRRGEEVEVKEDITTIDDLMITLRRSRIDREKLEAVENYIEHCSDELQQLKDYMHKIMSLFIFQASRRLLLAHLIKLHDDQMDKGDKGDKGKSPATQRKAENLAEAIKHADEEVRRLEYWSDIKCMAERGESGGAVDRGKGWDRGWEGLDKSGPKGVKDEGELP